MSERVVGFEDRMAYLNEGREALLARVEMYVRVRLVVNAVLFILTLFSYLPNITPDGWALLAMIAVDAALVWGYQALARHGRTVELTYAHLSLSTLWITIGVHLSGGFFGGLTVLYLLIVLVGGLVMGQVRAGYVLASVCATFYLTLAGIEVSGLALPWYVPSEFYLLREQIHLQMFISTAAILVLSLFGTAALVGVVIRLMRGQARARREAQAQMAQAKEESNHLRDVMAQQSATLEHLTQVVSELAAPVIPVAERVVVVPIVGRLDADRARRVMRVLLRGVARHRARVVILDLTGLSAVDEAVAGRVVDATRATKLLGAQAVLVGAGAEMAEAIADLELDVGELITRGDLQGGIQYALSVVGEQAIVTDQPVDILRG
jgi:anti-anti-sigma regulatory factor